MPSPPAPAPPEPSPTAVSPWPVLSPVPWSPSAASTGLGVEFTLDGVTAQLVSQPAKLLLLRQTLAVTMLRHAGTYEQV